RDGPATGSSIANVAIDTGPGWFHAEARPHIAEQIGELLIAEHAGKTRHDGASLAVCRRQSPEHDIHHVAPIGTVWTGAQREIDAAERQQAVAIMAQGA